MLNFIAIILFYYCQIKFLEMPYNFYATNIEILNTIIFIFYIFFTVKSI